MTYNRGKPLRREKTKKPDGILNPEATAAESACHFACAPFDRATKAADRKWGMDVLPGLVSVETAAKYGKAVGKLSEAIQERNPALVEQWAGVCIRGLTALDAEATQAGHRPAGGKFTEGYVAATDDRPALRFGVLHDDAERQAAQAKRPDLMFFTAHEVGLALQQKLATPLVVETKKRFPGATVTRIKPADPVNWAAGGDEIPDF